MNVSAANNLLHTQAYQDRSVSYIGHGRRESAPETMSPLHVISHELGHVQEFKQEALRSGSEIRDIHVKINYEFRDGRMVAVSGETSAITQKRETEERRDPKLEPYSDGKSLKDRFEQSLEESKKKDKKDSVSSAEKNDQLKKEELETKIKDLEQKLGSQKSKETSSFNNSIDPTSKSEREKEMESEKRRLEEEVRILKMKEALKESFDMLTDIRKLMVSNIFGMMQVGNETKAGGVFNALV
ncbi:hypothetical protein LPTSP4_17430 [Leptospira ryugenii]|uniref:Uncharacterized protein n=1 Tax=Leptospira ryugenii TaxID=1917863 RepID=A0A2P2E017_9LEPT|nr:hypothetical protein [Leptospira ryugenii]GBF50219.1 hypothetical protein LPTSP4_17430 [Leptospira ryugenii]